MTNFGTDDFTVEYWVYPTASTNGYTQHVGSSATSTGIAFGTGTSMGLYATTVAVGFGGNLNIIVNQWNHIAWTRQNGLLRGYLNGAVGYSASVTTNFNEVSTTVGAASSGSNHPLTGYISDLRVLKGNAVYTTSSITVPTSPSQLTPNVTLKLSFTHGGIVDATTRHVFETLGDAKISNVASKFGIGSLFFDGTSDGLGGPYNPLYAFGTGDFTIEFWINFASKTGYQTILWFGYPTNTPGGWIVQTGNGDGNINFYFGGGGGTVNVALETGSTVNNGTWYHVAIVRTGGNTRIYRNGTQVATGADTNTYGPATTTRFFIGGGDTTGFGNYFLNGYLDDVRITRFARYTANFTAPNSAAIAR